MSKRQESRGERGGLQQDDNYKDFMKLITDGGLRYAVAKTEGDPNANALYRKTVEPDKKRQVIVVGAGITGLSAAYELAQIGHEVTILESQSRVGGRLYTFRFTDGLHCEAGAMRLPPNHFLTKHYIDLFQVETRPFQNYNKNGYMCIYGEKARMEDFEKNNKYYSDKWWPGWDANLSPELKLKAGIQGILDLYKKTVEPVRAELGKNPSKETWQTWAVKWSKMSLEDFLRSTVNQKDDDLQLRPWPEEAIRAYKVATYTPECDIDLATYLRDELGEWWEDPLYTPVNGMDAFPKAFMKKNKYGWNKNIDLSKAIVYGMLVEKVEHVKKADQTRIRVTGTSIVTGQMKVFEGDAVFLTVPLTILRQMDVPLSIAEHKALEGITYESSTKIMLQCKTRFWQDDVGQGGFSKTNMQIGQLHYPDYDNSGIPNDERGVLVVYTWGSNALTFGAQDHKGAIKSAVNQVGKIHPKIHEEFEVGKVQAWHSDPSAQGAYAGLLPFEYCNAFDTLVEPTETIYLAGEALSWSNGWVQGAIFSALCQAFSFQSFVETGKLVNVLKLNI